MLTTGQKEVLELISSNPLISSQEMTKVLSMNISAWRKHLDAFW